MSSFARFFSSASALSCVWLALSPAFAEPSPEPQEPSPARPSGSAPAAAPSEPAPARSAATPPGAASATNPSAPGPSSSGSGALGAAPAVAPAPPSSVDRSALLPPQAPPSREPAVTAPAVTVAVAATERPTDQGQVGNRPTEVYAEDWWSHTRPVLELHGYFRTRAELFHQFSLGRDDNLLWPHPLDHAYTDLQKQSHLLDKCGDDANAKEGCQDKTQAGANVRLRVNPEIHISDNLRILSQIDMLDNLVLGSTPQGYANAPSGGGYQVLGNSGYTQIGAQADTQNPPTAGINSFQNSITVKRAWGEYVTPLGQLRFGRMPHHWGLGILANSGDGYDSDWQSTIDRIQFVTGLRSADLYLAGSWDFVNEGLTSASVTQLDGGQPYDRAQLDDVNQYTVTLVRKRNPELAKLDLARGDAVLNGGAYFLHRNQYLANDNTTVPSSTASLGANPSSDGGTALRDGYVRRRFKTYTPDLWLQLLYRKFRFEAEGVMVYGSIENTSSESNTQLNGIGDTTYKIRQFGLATQTEYKAVEDKLRLNFGFGWASGDPGTLSLVPDAADAIGNRTGSRTIREFRFHPDYRIDLILHRNLLTRVQGTYYFRPSVDYDFSRNTNGQRLGGGAAVIWSRASEFVQAPGHKRDLGIELNFSLYYQAKDGSLNDSPDKMGGFYTMLQYGVLFPMGGLGYTPDAVKEATNTTDLSVNTAQTVRWYMGILF